MAEGLVLLDLEVSGHFVMSSRQSRKIRFTKHAREKFALLERYGFPLDEAAVKGTILSPSRVERRRGQVLATKPLDEEYAIRVVYRFINDNILVVTFYPVKRKRFNV